VCPVERQCEGKCRYSEINYSVTVARLQQYVASCDIEGKLFSPVFGGTPRGRVAVLGAGPAGLSCAWQLALAGVGSTVYERRHEPGGMLGWAIPSYRLPNEVRHLELQRFRIPPLIEVRAGTAAEPAVPLLDTDVGAVFVATGLQESARAGLPGEEQARFALEFLDEADQGALDCREEHVLVIGGGSVAMDVCGSALRWGARKVEAVCLEAPNEMPACKSEVDETLEQGVIIHTRLKPKEIVVETGKVRGMRAVAIEWKEPDKFVPDNAHEIPGTERFIPATAVVEAVGQRPAQDLDALLEGIDRARGLVTVNEEDMMTSIPGVFAGGDIVNGGSTVAAAVDHGNRAAMGILDYLKTSSRPAAPPPSRR